MTKGGQRDDKKKPDGAAASPVKPPLPAPVREDPAPSSAQTGTPVEIAPGVFAPDSAIRIAYSRSSGPGGQNVNKVNTKAQLWVPIDAITGLSPAALERLKTLAPSRITAAGEIHIAADTERTQESNRQAVLGRLRELLEQALREPRRRKKTRAPRSVKEKRLKGKKRRGEIKSKRRYRGDE